MIAPNPPVSSSRRVVVLVPDFLFNSPGRGPKNRRVLSGKSSVIDAPYSEG